MIVYNQDVFAEVKKSESTKIIKRRYGGRKRTDADFRVNVSRREGICKGISFSIDGQKEISGSNRKERVVTCTEIRHKEKKKGERMMTEIEKKEMTQEISEILARKLMNVTQEPEFVYGEKIRTTDVAKLLGKTAGWVQAGIINGWLPIGVATLEGKLVTNQNQIRSNKRVDYTIYPQKLWEVTGIIWKGRDTVNG